MSRVCCHNHREISSAVCVWATALIKTSLSYFCIHSHSDASVNVCKWIESRDKMMKMRMKWERDGVAFVVWILRERYKQKCGAHCGLSNDEGRTVDTVII